MLIPLYLKAHRSSYQLSTKIKDNILTKYYITMITGLSKNLHILDISKNLHILDIRKNCMIFTASNNYRKYHSIVHIYMMMDTPEKR